MNQAQLTGHDHWLTGVIYQMVIWTFFVAW